jgi:RNA polymerase primary sigma factor
MGFGYVLRKQNIPNMGISGSFCKGRPMNSKPSRTNSSNILDTYFKQIKVFPLLTFNEELELSKKIIEGNQSALNKLINSNLRLVVKIARPYVKANISIMDIIQEGNMGLMCAAKKYNYRKNVRFSTYASWWIRQHIGRYLNNKCRIVKLPNRKEEILRRIQQTYNYLCQTLMHQPRSDEIACELGLSVQDVNYILNMSSGPLCLEFDKSSDEYNPVYDFHADYTYSPEKTFLSKSSRDGTMRFLDTLKDREKRIITYRFQLDGCERHTLKKISDKMGISPETVRQIEMKALKKIRSCAEDLKNVVFLEAI